MPYNPWRDSLRCTLRRVLLGLAVMMVSGCSGPGVVKSVAVRVYHRTDTAYLLISTGGEECLVRGAAPVVGDTIVCYWGSR